MRKLIIGRPYSWPTTYCWISTISWHLSLLNRPCLSALQSFSQWDIKFHGIICKNFLRYHHEPLLLRCWSKYQAFSSNPKISVWSPTHQQIKTIELVIAFNGFPPDKQGDETNRFLNKALNLSSIASSRWGGLRSSWEKQIDFLSRRAHTSTLTQRRRWSESKKDTAPYFLGISKS